MRITLGMLTDRVRTNLLASSERLMEAHEVASSGKRIQRPSDDIAGTSRSITLRSALASIEQFDRNAGLASSHLAMTSSALDTVVSALQEVRLRALEAANSIMTDEAWTATATQLDRITQDIVGAANTQHLERYIFSGSLSDTKPIIENVAGPPPYIYQGDGEQFSIRVGPETSIPVSVTGDMVFNMGGAAVPTSPDVFSTIEALKEKVLARDVTGISDQIADIDANMNNVIAIRSQVGARLNRLETSNDMLLDSKLDVAGLLSQTEDADLAEAIVELRTRENVYEAAIATASRILEISLADFLD